MDKMNAPASSGGGPVGARRRKVDVRTAEETPRPVAPAPPSYSAHAPTHSLSIAPTNLGFMPGGIDTDLNGVTSKLPRSDSGHSAHASQSLRGTKLSVSSSKPVSSTGSKGLHSYTHKRVQHTKPSVSKLPHKTSPPLYTGQKKKEYKFTS